MMHSLGSMVATMMMAAVVGVDVVADVADVVSYCVTTYRARSYC